MILIADSGSTKTDWRLQDENKKIHQFRTIGFNPRFQSTKEISDSIAKDLVPKIVADKVNKVFYYGVACSSPDKIKIVEDALKNNFKNAKIEVNHDLLGAARALCQHNEGIAAILGTGSNSCYYDGENIKENITSLGYILGDEGGGAYMGMKLIKYYMEDELPEDLHQLFQQKYKLTNDQILDSVYSKPLPIKFFGSFTPFLLHNIRHPFINRLIYDAFNAFFQKQICKYSRHKEVKLSCTGSIAFYFVDILRQVASDCHVTLDKVIETPIAGLTLYHCPESF